MLGFVLPIAAALGGLADLVRRWGQVGVLLAGLALLARVVARRQW